MLLKQYEELFKDDLGAIRDANSKPVFWKTKPIPFSIKDMIGNGLNRLEQEGILKKVNQSE